MKNYKNSDYAVNKYSEGIVYRFADETIEVTLENFLIENPDKTETDFYKLKALSDEIYYQQDRAEQRQTKRNVTLECIGQEQMQMTESLEDEMIHSRKKMCSMLAAKKLLDSGKLTDIQRRRFILYIFKGLSLREIAKTEGISHLSIYRSLNFAFKKLKKYFDEIG